MDSNLQIEQNIVTKFSVRNDVLYANVSWKENEKDLFHIKVFYDDSTWTGKYSNELATDRRKQWLIQSNETGEDYNTYVKNCLSGTYKDIIYDFTKNPDDINSASFTWKKPYEYEGKKMLMTQGVVLLQRDDIPTNKDILIDILLDKNNILISEVLHAKNANDELKRDLEQYIERLEELTDSKILLESTLYGKFVQVLNEKKRRIQLLQEYVES